MIIKVFELPSEEEQIKDYLKQQLKEGVKPDELRKYCAEVKINSKLVEEAIKDNAVAKSVEKINAKETIQDISQQIQAIPENIQNTAQGIANEAIATKELVTENIQTIAQETTQQVKEIAQVPQIIAKDVKKIEKPKNKIPLFWLGIALIALAVVLAVFFVIPNYIEIGSFFKK